MKNGYVKVLLNIVVLLAILGIMDALVGWLGEKYIRWLSLKPRNSDAALVNYNVNAAKPDIAVLGSSTAICHYNPDIIHDSLLAFTGNDYEVFNMGVSNQRLTYDYYGLKCLLERTHPKFVIVDVWASYISAGDPSFSFEAFKPYANINQNIKTMLIGHNKYDLPMQSNMYCYNTELVKLIMAAFKSSNTNGFISSKVEMKNVIKEHEQDTTGLLPLSVDEFDSMISLAKNNNIRLFVVLSPTLSSADTTSLSYLYMKNRCKECNIPFMDYSNDTGYYHTRYFRDVKHMNFYGAELFTSHLMHDIKTVINN